MLRSCPAPGDLYQLYQFNAHDVGLVHDLWLAIDVRRSPGVGDSFTVRGLHYTTGQLRTMAGNRSWWNDHRVEEP